MLTAATRQKKTWLNGFVWFLVAHWQLHRGRWFVLREAPDWAIESIIAQFEAHPPQDEIDFQLRDEAEAEQRQRRRLK